MSRRVMIALALLASAPPVPAAPDDYAKGLMVYPEGSSSMARMVVPAGVYETVTSASLDDVAVYNADGEAVPFAMWRPPDVTESWSEWQSLPVFPLPDTSASGESGAKIEVQLAEDGTVIAIDGAAVEAEATRFLIDASNYPAPIDQLRVERPDGEERFVTQARLESSDDLTHWRPVGGVTTLLALTGDGYHLMQNEMGLPSVRAPYLRLTLSVATAPLPIRRVEVQTRRAALRPHDSKVLAASVSAERQVTVLEYDTGGRFPVSGIALALPRPNQALTAEVYSMDEDEDAERQFHGEHLFYRGDIGSPSMPLAISTISHRLWSLETRQAAGAPAPDLVISWLPHEVVFLRQGRGPFTLAFGRGDPESPQWPLSRLKSILDTDTAFADLPEARVGEVVTLGGARRLTPPRRLPWQRMVLWAVLVLGVALIGGLALRLVRPGELHRP